MNANCYKIIFSKRLGTLVAVGEHTSSTGKAASGQGCRGSVLADGFVGALRFTFASVALACLSLGNTQAQSSSIASTALPQAGSVSTGSATISTQGAAMAITQSTDKASINWQSFNVGTGASVNIAQPSSDAVLLNRVVGNDPSQILGKLSANGQVILLNPNGVLFGKDGSVTASAFTASTFGLSDADFMAGYYKYNRNGSTAAVVNQGTIETSAGGFVALIGATVTNEGTIHAPQGDVVMAAAESVTLPEELVKPQPVTTPNTVSVRMSKRVRLELDPAAINTAVNNTESGVIVTEGGQVLLQAAAISSAVASVTHSGRIDTSAPQAGAVTVLADNGVIKVDGSIKANSSGTDSQGQTRTGGDIIIGRDIDTGVLARGTDVSGAALESGHGFVETSGDVLSTTGTRVKAGEWLLDPYNITIAASGATGTAYASSYASGADSIILASDISANLTAGTSVTIATGAGSGSSGNISVNESIAKTGGGDASLTLQAHGNINVAAGKTITSDIGKLNVVFNSDSDATGGGAIVFNVGSGITSNGGNITLGGGNALNGTDFAVADGVNTLQGISLNTAAINAGGGNIVMNGKTAATNYQANLSNISGIYMAGGSISTTGSGTINLTGNNQNTDTQSQGFVLSSGTITGGSTGAVTITGDSRAVTSSTYTYIRGALVNGTVTSTGGNIGITGYGGAGVQYDYGVDVGGSVTTTGAGAVNITGTAGAGGSGGNVGVTTSGTGNISSVDGSISITGTGGIGNGAQIRDHGVQIGGSNAVASTGTGDVTVTGTVTNNDNGFSQGVAISAGGLRTNSGNIKVDGTALLNYQVAAYINAPVTSTSGNIYIRTAGANIQNTTAGTISGNNVSIDNTGGTIDANGVITKGVGGASTWAGVIEQDGVKLSGSVTAANNLNVYGNQTGSAKGVSINGASTTVSGKNLTLYGNSSTGNGVLLSGATLSGQYINATGATNTGTAGFAWQGGNINTTGTAGTSTSSLVKGISAASANTNGFGAFMMIANSVTNAASGTSLTFAGEATNLAAGVNTNERGILVQGGYTLTSSGDITFDGSSKSSEGIAFGGTINTATVAGVTNKITIKGTAAASSNNSWNAINFSGAINGNAATSSINFLGDAKNLSGANKDNAVNISGAITGSAANINIQSTGATIVTSAAITGAHISIDNTNGTINAGTGAITTSSGTSGSATAISIGGNVTATGNLNLSGISTGGTGINVVTAKAVSGANIQATGKTTNGSYGVLLNGSNSVTTTGTSGDSQIKGLTTAGGTNALLAGGGLNLTSATGTSLTLWGDGTNTGDRAARFDGGVTTNGAVTLKGTSTNATSLIFINGAVTANANSTLTLSGTTNGSGQAAVYFVNGGGVGLKNGATVNITGQNTNTAGTGTGVLIQGSGIYRSTATAGTVSITGSTSSMAAGSTGVSVQAGVSTDGNIDIQGNVASASSTGVAITSSGGVASRGSNTTINIGSNYGITHAGYMNVSGATGTGSSINLTSTNNSISGTGTIGDTTNKNASVKLTTATTSTFSGGINASNFTKAGIGSLTLDSWAQTPSVLTNISNAYTVKDGGSLTINTFGLNYPQLNPASVNIENASTFSLNQNSNGFWKSTAFNFTGGLGGGTLNLVGNPVGTSSTTNTFSTSGGATNTVTGLLNANSANVNLTLNAATSGTTLSDGSYAALAFTTNVQGGYGIDNASTITISGGGGVLFKDKIRATTLNINAGTLQMGDGSAITAATTPDLNATNVGIESGAKLLFNRPDTHTNSSTISGAGELIKTGSGTTILIGDNTYNGTTTISAGTLQIGNDTTTGTLGTGAVINNATLEFKRSANTLVSNNITGTGDLLATLSAGGLKFSGDVALDGDIDLTASHATGWHGIQLSGNLSAAGDINLTGASSTRYGILIDAFKTIQTTGNAPQSVVMTGDAANLSTAGIAIIGAINTQNGSTLLATGTNTGGGNGIYNELTTGGTNYGKIGSATSGDITLIGTSSGGSAATAINTDLALNQGHALLLRGDITSKGHISLTGTADNGLGVFLQHSTYDYGRTMAEAQPTIQVVSGGANMAGQSAISISGTNLGSNPFSNNGVLIGSKIINNSTGGATTITSQEGGVALVKSTTGSTTGSGTITNASTAGAITITAGDGTAASTASVGDLPSSISIGNSVTRAWTLGTAGTQITQNSNAGVTITSDGLGNVTPAKIINNGTGDVVIGAGIQNAAGTATGGNVLTASGNTLTQASTGKTYVYTGSASGSGALANLSSNFNTLFYAGNTGTINTAFNKAYNSTIAGGPNSQALFRQDKGPSYALNFNNLSKTYGDVDPTNLNATFLADYLATGGGTNISQAISGTGGSNTFTAKTTDIFNDLTITRAIGTDAGTYAYTMTGNTLIDGLTGSTSLVIRKRDITLTGITASNKTYDGSSAATITSGTLSNLVAGEALLLSGVGAFSDANVGNGKTVTANTALLNKADSTGKWANYNLTTSGNVTGLANITPAALTITVNGSSAFVTQDPNSAFNQGFGYAGFVNGETASTALTTLPTRTYIGAANPSVGTYANAYDLTAIPQAANGNYTITVQKGTLNVVAADALMLTVASQSQVYGALTAANEAVPAQGTVTAQYCLVQANCNGGNLVNLNLRKDTTTPNQWIISDNTSSTVQFGLTLTGASYSTGGFVQVGNYDYSLSAASPMVIGTQNFNTVVANTGSLGVTPLAVTLQTTPVTKTYDGNTTLPSTTLSVSNTAASDDLQVSFIAGEFGSSAVSSAAAFSLYGVTLAGNDIANYSMANYTNSTYLGTGSITKSGGGNNTNPQPIHPPKPIIPTNNSGESGGGESGGSSAGNPYLLVPNNRNNSADRCTPNTLEDCLCEIQEPKPVEGLAICYQPKKTAGTRSNSKAKQS